MPELKKKSGLRLLVLLPCPPRKITDARHRLPPSLHHPGVAAEPALVLLKRRADGTFLVPDVRRVHSVEHRLDHLPVAAAALDDLRELVQAPGGTGIVLREHDNKDPGPLDGSLKSGRDLAPLPEAVIVDEDVVDSLLPQGMAEVADERVARVFAPEAEEHIVAMARRGRMTVSIETETTHGDR